MGCVTIVVINVIGVSTLMAWDKVCMCMYVSTSLQVRPQTVCVCVVVVVSLML